MPQRTRFLEIARNDKKKRFVFFRIIRSRQIIFSFCKRLRITASFNRQAFLKLIGAELEHVEKGKVVISCRHKETLTQQQGLLHGGVVTSNA